MPFGLPTFGDSLAYIKKLEPYRRGQGPKMYPYQDPASKSEVKSKSYDDASLLISWAVLVPFVGIFFAAYLYQRGPDHLLVTGALVDAIERYLLPPSIFGIIHDKFYLQFFICGAFLFWFCFIVFIFGLFLKWPKTQAKVLTAPADWLAKPLIVALLPLIVDIIIIRSTYSNVDIVNTNTKFSEAAFIVFGVVAYPGASGAMLGMWINYIKLFLVRPKSSQL